MKKICFIIWLAAFAASCKKEGSGSGSGKLLLAKEFRNDLLEGEYIYNTAGKLVRVNFFATGGGLSTLSTYRLYQYDNNGKISEVVHYSKDHNPTVRRVYAYDANGKVSRIDEATAFLGSSDLDIMDYFEVYTYDAAGLLENMTRRLTNYTMHHYTDYTYDNKGSLTGYESWYLDNGNMVLKQKSVVGPGNKIMPNHWKEMMLTPTDFSMHYLYDDTHKYTSYWSGPANVTDWSFINRLYNDQGYVTSQTLQIKYEDGSLGSGDYSYEYIQP